MDESKANPTTIDEYIDQFPEDIQQRLSSIRAAIKEAAPEATERISYRMPAFYQKGNLVYFAAFKNHIGFFPTASGVEAFKDELSAYTWSKGTVHFPFDQPIPYDLIKKIVRFKVRANTSK